MNRPFHSDPRLTLSALVTSVTLTACSSSSTTAAVDAGATPTDEQFCSAVIAGSNHCNAGADAGACTNAEVALYESNCSQIASVFSNALKSASVACEPCFSYDPVVVVSSSCGANAARVALSAAQNKLAQDYCAVCAGASGLTMAACEGAFWGLEGDAGASISGIGIGALPYSDAIIGLVDTTCIPELDAGSQLGCVDPFAACVGATTATAYLSALPIPSACTPGADAGE
jgi:hypothetical protein